MFGADHDGVTTVVFKIEVTVNGATDDVESMLTAQLDRAASVHVHAARQGGLIEPENFFAHLADKYGELAQIFRAFQAENN